MKKNGFTLIELLVCFTIILIVSVSLFKTVLSILNKEQKSIAYNEYLVFATEFNDVIQADFGSDTITSFITCGSNCYDITYSNKGIVRLSIDKTNNTMTYGDTKDTLPSNYKFYNDINITNNTVSTSDENKYNGLLVINIPIKNTLISGFNDLQYIYQYNSNTNNVTY